MKKICTIFVIGVFLALGMLPGCKKKLPTSPDVPEAILPSIEYFTASPESIGWKESSTLLWGVKNAPIVYIDQGIGNVSTSGNVITSGTIDVSPEETTTYTLTAVGSSGTITASCTVEVTARAIFELTSYSTGYTTYGYCEITGIVKNMGNATGQVAELTFQAYNAENVIIAVASLPNVDWGYIPPGAGVAFSIAFSDLTDWGLVAELKWVIYWWTESGTKLTQTGVITFK